MNSRLVVRLGLDEDDLPPSRAVPVTIGSLRLSQGQLPVIDQRLANWEILCRAYDNAPFTGFVRRSAVLGQH